MRRYTQQNHAISGVFIFLLLGIFAVFSMLMVLIGAQVYKGSVDRSEEHNSEMIASSYIRNKLREADGVREVTAEELNGAEILCIVDPEEETTTFIYVYEGKLYEWYAIT